MMDLLELRTKNLTVKMKLFDAHCHLQDKRVIDQASQLISAAFSCRCNQFRSQWTSEKDWDLVKEMGEMYPSVVPCIGVHPCDTDEIGAETENFLVDAIESSDSSLLGNETAGGTINHWGNCCSMREFVGFLFGSATNSSTSEKHNSYWRACRCARIFHGCCTVVRDACVLVLRYVPPDGVPLSSHWSSRFN
ncbi:uncharacterized protein LOC110229988 isoform X2 [Arabidopsis lyrata subsp. lyrata]|uniref:uncharacterized protein LOC110229988 isoform X2 n=1 Tax=Arabidopsis lyrata subsp. lyrata TaxID=81972 RepID=UPI000A29BD2B|nr:uncharacterized protein LOC110229988 isoform X2 [Arabidopsis lyrata subsp. lyrata]|eukprot:XP_020887044.1 uncharacterized protein LOC110229988 isoform X2 [Arabidopsis lyrata subsp. lyrata]